MSFWCCQFSQKTNMKTQVFALAYWGRNFLFIFWENWNKPKCLFEINWPLACPFPTLPKAAHNNYSLNDLWVTYKIQKAIWLSYHLWTLKDHFLFFKWTLKTQFSAPLRSKIVWFYWFVGVFYVSFPILN